MRENLATFLEEAQEHGGLPRHVEKEFFDYLDCGVLANGFARVRCEACGDELLVAFSCKRRGVCPSCNSRRVHDTAIHLVERVLPQVPFRQWTLSFPKRIRGHLARDASWASQGKALRAASSSILEAHSSATPTSTCSCPRD